MTATDESTAEAAILAAYRDHYRWMLERRTDLLDGLLDDSFRLVHMSGYDQPKDEWLADIDEGRMQYHVSKEESVAVDVAGDAAVLVGRNRVTATIYGSSSTWRLQLTMRFAKRKGAWTITHSRATTY